MNILSYGVAPLALLLALVAPARAVTIVFDYSYDTSGFFTANPTAKADLDAAAAFYDSHLTDTLSAIVPSDTNTWSAVFVDPATGSNTSVANLSIAQDELLVYVGGSDLGDGILGLGGPGGFSISGSSTFLDTVRARGQSGALLSTPTDFGPWGGSIRFDLNTTWYFDPDPATTESFAGQNDFYSTALHELGHVLGLGTASSWNAQIDGSEAFAGANSETAFGGPVPLDPQGAHWAEGTMSTVFGGTTPQEAEMTPDLSTGTRKVVTTLDVAGLQDVGWTVAIPEPATAGLLLCAFGLGLWRTKFQSG